MQSDPTRDAQPSARHLPVLVAEVMACLEPRAGETALDCTAGLGGHAAELAARLGAEGTLILNDADGGNLAEAQRRALAALHEKGAAAPAIVALQGNFADAPRKLVERGLSADVVLADLGFASSQMEDAARGLSFSRDGPLDMRFDRASPVSAETLVASLSERELEEILRDFGEEREARRIAQAIVRTRQTAPIRTTHALAEVVRGAMGARARGQRIDPATRTFQALRIAVNDELGSLTSLLESVTRAANALSLPADAAGRAAAKGWLRPGARLAMISFHSLEDRLVKRAFAELTDRGLASPAPPTPRQPIGPSDFEQEANPRSRSAKLRGVRLGADTPRLQR